MLGNQDTQSSGRKPSRETGSQKTLRENPKHQPFLQLAAAAPSRPLASSVHLCHRQYCRSCRELGVSSRGRRTCPVGRERCGKIRRLARRERARARTAMKQVGASSVSRQDPFEFVQVTASSGARKPVLRGASWNLAARSTLSFFNFAAGVRRSVRIEASEEGGRRGNRRRRAVITKGAKRWPSVLTGPLRLGG